jgi:hypothetical protein
MSLFILAIFLSAFLLFQVQPLIARYLLPWFGGVPAVWSTVQMFFQILLTAGYAYADWIAKSGRRGERYHRLLLPFSAILLLVLGAIWNSPITPSAGWKPSPDAPPIAEILRLLAISVGLPYFLLASTSPLIQAWFHRRFPQRTPYFLYVFSNLGSLLGLLAYPVIIEPLLGLRRQGWTWSALYLVDALLLFLLTWQAGQRPDTAHEETPTSPAPSWWQGSVWMGLAATASLFLLATTAQITQEIAVVPFLWVLPLTVYLLSFIITFSGERWYRRGLFSPLMLLATVLVLLALAQRATMPVLWQIAIYTLLLFTVSMVCHGELYRLRPEPAHLTRFYLLVSLGGALGGIFVTLIAPSIFPGYWEYPFGLSLAWLFLLFMSLRPTPRHTSKRPWRLLQNALLAIGVGISLALSYQFVATDLRQPLWIARNFYGVIKVLPSEKTPARYLMTHGATVHGFQYLEPGLQKLPTAYYGEQSGAGLAILHHPRRGQGMRVGVLGLGIGTLATYGQVGDVYRFYEINPQVIELASGKGGYFTYLKQSAARIELIPGDARLSLERELEQGQAQQYDVLVLDVFSGDSIPTHLLNREAFALYLAHLNPQGILAVHISNRHLDLLPVVWKLADFFHLERLLISNPGDGERNFPSRWVLLARQASLFAPQVLSHASDMHGYTSPLRLWTDDYSNLIQILK